ncbi:hypothetical protein L915_00397, partial [Phytophthora nicotianae]
HISVYALWGIAQTTHRRQGRHHADDRHHRRLPRSKEAPSYCTFANKRRVNCGARQ